MKAVWILVAVVVVILGASLLLKHKHVFQQAQIAVATKVQVADELPAYDTLEEAAVYGAKRLYLCSHVYECGALIAQRIDDHKYVIGPVASSYAGDHVNFSRNAPPTVKIVATIHSHPCLPESHEVPYFSPEDTADDISHGQPGFLLNQCTGEVSVFDPHGKPTFERLPDYDDDVYLSKGVIIGKIPVDGKSVEPVTGFNQ